MTPALKILWVGTAVGALFVAQSLSGSRILGLGPVLFGGTEDAVLTLDSYSRSSCEYRDRQSPDPGGGPHLFSHRQMGGSVLLHPPHRVTEFVSLDDVTIMPFPSFV